jgi:RND family efflux transporter MFP subunit
MRAARMSALLLALVFLGGCGRSSETPDRGDSAVPALEFIEVQPRRATRERVWDGVVEAVNQATLSAQTGGRVLELPFDVNDYVEAGDVVVRFTDVEQRAGLRQAQAGLSAAQAAAREAEADFLRISEIYARRLVARAQLDQAEARLASARAQLDSARAALKTAEEQLDYTEVRAPYSGIVTERLVEVGETVGPGQPLISGLSVEQLRLQVRVPQSDIAALREHGRAFLLLADGRRIEASRVTIFPYADPASHSFSVRVELPQAETGLSPGMSAKVAVVIGEAERVLLPVGALLKRSEVTAAYVWNGQGLLLRQLRLGHRYGDEVEILAGLQPGEQVARDPVAAGLLLQQQAQGRDDG